MENNNGPNSLLVEINCIENTKSDDVQSTSTKQSADYTDDSVLENFKISLANLKVNDKKLIESLTKVAGIGYQKASEIVHIIVNSESAEGLLKLYLIDSIIKGVGGPYIGFFSNELVKAFAKVFRIADYECRKKLFMLRNTWNGVVSQSTLTSLDITINEMDGNWPVNLNENPILIQTSIAMFIKSFLFEKLQTNEKIVEARIATDKYSIIKVGDTIKFICGSRITMRRVIGKAKYDSFQELLKKEGVNNCLPGATDLAEAVNYYRCFSNYKTLELIHGVLAFRLEPKDNDSGSNENGTFKFEGEGKRKPPDVNASAFDGSQGVIKKTQKERIGNIHDTPQELVLNVPKQVPKRVPKPICSIYDYNSEDDFEKDYTSQELFANAIVPESVGKCKPSDSKSGRPKDDVWSFVKTINGNIVCIYCEKKISPKAVRIRKHLSKCRPPTSTKNIVVIENIQIKAPGEKSILELDGPGDEKAVPITAIRTPITQKSKIPPTKPSRLQSKTQVEQLDGSRNDYRLDEIKSQEDIQVGKNPPVTKDVVIIQAPGEKSILELDGPGDEKAVPITAIRTPITQKSKIPPTKPSRLQSKTQVEQLDGSRNDYRLDEIKSQEDIQVGKNPPVTKDVVIIQAPGEKSILELDGPGDEKAVPITAIRTPITQKSKIPPTKPSRLQSKTQVEQLDSSRNDYRLDEIKSQEDIQVEKNPPVTKDVVIIQDEESILLCYLCGSPMPKLKCDECDESFCIKCFSIYHHHPLRKSHLSKEIVEPKLLKEDPREWINTTEKLSIPKELWSKIYDIKEGKIVTRAFTFYKNEIGDLLEKIVKCVILVRDQYTGKVMTIYTRCKHENCRRYNLICTNFNCESPIFAIHRTTNSVQHSEYLTKQLRGSTRVSNAEELKRTMPATHFRNMVDKAPEYLLAEKNASTIKSQEVFKKCRSQGLKKQDLSPDDFKDLVMLQEETKDEKYISKVISPYGVYMHDSKQFKLLHQLISQNKKVKIETIGRSDATGNVVTVAVVDGKPILYYTLMIQLKSDENNKHFTPFPVSEMLSVTHDASAIADWLFSFKACYLKEYPADFPILDRLITDFSYANIHAILHAFNATNIHLYLNEAYAYATQQKTFNATLLFWVKIHLCCTHLSNTFAENVHTHFNKKNNQRATNEQKVISEVLAAMMSMRNYNQLKETWHNLCILMKSKSENETTTQALQNLQRLCTEEFDPTKTFNYDYLMYGGDDISLEHFEADGSILDKPIYKSSKFYKDFSIIFNEVKTGTDLKIKKPTNPYYNESFLQSFMKRFVAILPLWTGLLLTDKSKFIRLNNQPIESYNKIVKDLLAEKCLEIGFRVRCTRFIKLMRGMINSNFKLIFWQVPTRRLNHGKQKSSQINSSSQILKNLSKLNSSSPVLQPETSSQTKITPNLQVPRKANKTSTSTSIHGVIQTQGEESILQLDGLGVKEMAVGITAIRTPITQKSKLPRQATKPEVTQSQATKSTTLQRKSQGEQLDGCRNQEKALTNQIRKSSRLAARLHDDEQGAGPKKIDSKGHENTLVVPAIKSTRKAAEDKTSIKNAAESWSKRKYKGKRRDRISYFQGKTLKSLKFENTEEEIVDVETI